MALIPCALLPNGACGVEIWVHCGDNPPIDDDQFQMYTLATRMKATVAFTGEQAGKTAYFRFRYFNPCGQVGPRSMIYSLTILK